jgi:hypothetical protein
MMKKAIQARSYILVLLALLSLMIVACQPSIAGAEGSGVIDATTVKFEGKVDEINGDIVTVDDHTFKVNLEAKTERQLVVGDEIEVTARVEEDGTLTAEAVLFLSVDSADTANTNGADDDSVNSNSVDDDSANANDIDDDSANSNDVDDDSANSNDVDDDSANSNDIDDDSANDDDDSHSGNSSSDDDDSHSGDSGSHDDDSHSSDSGSHDDDSHSGGSDSHDDDSHSGGSSDDHDGEDDD